MKFIGFTEDNFVRHDPLELHTLVKSLSSTVFSYNPDFQGLKQKRNLY